MINQTYSSQKRRLRRTLSAFRMGQKRVHRRLLRLKKTYTWLKVPHFLTDKEQYLYLRSMFQTRRVFMVRGDLTAEVTMRKLGAALAKAGLVSRVLYLSNCEMYFKYNRQYRKNIRGLPTDRRSVVIRTRAWREWVREGKRPLHYLYVTQTHDNFLLWLAHRTVRDMRQLIPHEQLKPEILYYEITDTLKQRRAVLRKKRAASRKAQKGRMSP